MIDKRNATTVINLRAAHNVLRYLSNCTYGVPRKI